MKRLSLGLTGLALACLLLAGRAQAITTVSQGYVSSDKLSLGSIVSLQNNSADHVSAASNTNLNGILGVVIGANSSLLSLDNGDTNQVQIATSGVEQVLVSDINGKISNGDYITASPISGVGMKATSSVKVIGIAQSDLTSKNASRQSYTEKGGSKKDTLLGQIPVIINVSYYSKQPDKTLIPGGVQSIANALAGKTVSPLPILISSGIFIVTIIAVVSIIYSMIRSSIISVGRNPMSQSAIYRDVVQMSALVVGILGVAVAAIYLILRKF